MNIQHIKHIRSANAARLITNDKHPPLIIAFYYKYNKFFFNIQIFYKFFCKILMLSACSTTVSVLSIAGLQFVFAWLWFVITLVASAIIKMTAINFTR